MNKVEILLSKWLLKYPIEKGCPHDEIIVSGPGSELNDCFYVKFTQKKDEKFPSLFITGTDEDFLVGKEWDEEAKTYSKDVRIPLRDFDSSFLKVTHYHKGNITVFTGLWDFVINRVTRWPYMYSFLCSRNFQIKQFIFNQTLLDVNDPIKLLDVVKKHYLAEGKPISAIDLLVRLYELKAVGHPDFDKTLNKIERLLNLYVDSEDLLKKGAKYQITGQGFKLLEQHKYSTDTHIENSSLQKQIIYLTYWIFLLTFAMAAINVFEHWQLIKSIFMYD